MTAEQAATAALGAGLTLLGAIILFVLQTAQERLKDRRLHHREWHRDLVDIMAELDRLMIYLSGMLRDGTIFTAEIYQSVTIDVYSDKGLYWRMARIERGHPDRKVRTMMHAIIYAVTRITYYANRNVHLKISGETSRLVAQREKVDHALKTFREALGTLTSTIHEESGRRHLVRLSGISRRRKVSSHKGRASTVTGNNHHEASP